jgi:uncharacterized protein
MRIFVTGATGLVGRRLVERLRQRGDEVVALSRSAHPSEPGLTFLTGDPTKPGPWLEVLAGCDAVVHLAGEPILGRRWRAGFKQLIRSTRVDSTRLIAEALARQPRRPDGSPKAFVCASGIAYYGPHDDEELDEDAPPAADFLAEVCIAWEQAARPAAEAGVRVTNIRTGVVLDPEGGALPKLARPFRWFVGGRVGSGRQWMSWIHYADHIGIYLLALDDARAAGPLNGTAPEPVKNWGFCQMLGKGLRRPCWLPVPSLVLRIALGQAATLVTTGQRVLPRRALQLGYSFRFPDLEGALRDLFGRPKV